MNFNEQKLNEIMNRVCPVLPRAEEQTLQPIPTVDASHASRVVTPLPEESVNTHYVSEEIPFALNLHF